VRLEVSQDERSSEVVVRLGPAVLEIGGRVVDESGAPVRGALIWPATPTPFGRALEGGPLYAESLALPAEPFPWQEAVTDADGRFRLDGLLAKDYALGVRMPGRAPVTHLTCSAGELDVTLQLAAAPPPLVLRGTLRAPDGSPVVNATVGFESTLMDLPAVPGARPEFAQAARMRVRHVHTGRTFAIDPQRESLRAIGAVVAVTDPSGSFELPGVPSDGERFLWVTSPDHLPHEVRLDDGALEIDVRVAVRRRLQVLREAEDPAFDSVRVVDASGEELALVEELGDWTTERVRLPVSGERSAWRAVSATAAELVFELDGVEVARCRLQAGPGVTLERSGPLRVTGK